MLRSAHLTVNQQCISVRRHMGMFEVLSMLRHNRPEGLRHHAGEDAKHCCGSGLNTGETPRH